MKSAESVLTIDHLLDLLKVLKPAFGDSENVVKMIYLYDFDKMIIITLY